MLILLFCPRSIPASSRVGTSSPRDGLLPEVLRDLPSPVGRDTSTAELSSEQRVWERSVPVSAPIPTEFSGRGWYLVPVIV